MREGRGAVVGKESEGMGRETSRQEKSRNGKGGRKGQDIEVTFALLVYSDRRNGFHCLCNFSLSCIQ
jgi:hypothetical protein